jgi:ABC-type branched-subunit amino acid transport system substrate-binding protein
MGAVYLCEDLRLPGKRWAVKEMICSEPGTIEEMRRNFRREVAMLSGLRHRNMPLIVDCFSEADRDYLVMEYIEGQTLSQVIEREGPASEVQALRWGLEMARVLDYLHTQKPPIIFRDLKPENVMVSPGEGRHVKVIDFGLARHFDVRKSRDTHALGSVGYAAPEQWEDQAQSDARSDIYSLGATLYLVLTGRPPSPVYGTHRLRPYRPDLSSQTEALVLRCLEADPRRRYQTAAEVIRDLLLLLSRMGPSSPAAPAPTPAPPPPEPVVSRPLEAAAPAVRSSHPPRADRRAASLPRWPGGILVLATLLFLAGAALGWRSLPSAPPTAAETPSDSPEKAQARQHLEAGQYTQAAALLDTLVTRHPWDAEAHILKHNAYALMVQQKPPLRLAALMALTGPDAPEGSRLLHGIAQAQREANEAGGIEGRLVVVDIFDDASDTRRALEQAQKIVNDPTYLVSIGPFNSQRTLAVAPLFNGARMPMVTPVASDPRVWEAGPYVFTAADSNFPRIKALARRAAAAGLGRAAVLVDQESLLSSSMAAFFRDQFEALGGRVVAEIPYDIEEQPFDTQVQAIRASGAQLVFMADYRGAPPARLARALRRQGLSQPIYCQAIPFSQDLVTLGGKDVDGVMLSGTFHPDLPSPEVQAYVQRFHALFGDLSPSHLEPTAYDVTRLVLQGYARGVHSRQAMRDFLASLPVYHGISGRFSLARRLDERTVYVMQVRDGRYRLVDPR